MLDPRNYSTLPSSDVAGTLALAESLATAAPSSMTPLTQRALDNVNQAATTLQASWTASNRNITSLRKPADNWVDAAWGALAGRLEPYKKLRRAQSQAQATEATALLDAMLPNNLGFLNWMFEKEWAESERVLAWIEENGHWEALERLAGVDFVEELRAAHENYGRALGITEATNLPGVHNLQQGLNALRAAMRRYVSKLFGMLDEDNADSVQRITAALAPIDEARDRAAGRTPTATEDPQEAGPEPELTAGSTAGATSPESTAGATSPESTAGATSPGATRDAEPPASGHGQADGPTGDSDNNSDNT